MKIKLPLSQAAPLAEKIKAELEPGCERIEIAGSIRRRKAEVGDIEIVAIPRFYPSLFPDIVNGQSQLDIILNDLVAKKRLAPGDKNGPNYKNFFIPSIEGLKLDLFITSPECWPVIFAIRTGNADFSCRLVTSKSQGGLLPTHLKVAGGLVWNGSEPLRLGSEQEFLELCGGWVEPQARH